MNKKVVVVSALTVVLLMGADPARAQEPMGTAFTYQGLLESNGSTVTDTCNFEFQLGDGVSGPFAWDVVEGVEVSGGLFTTKVDFGPSSVNFNGEARWLNILVQCTGDADYVGLGPPQELTPTPYAIYAANGGGAGGYWAANGDHIYNDNAGNVGIGASTPDSARLQVETAATAGPAISGHASAATGDTLGVQGTSDSPDGIGVSGYASHDSGGNTAGFFRTNSSSGSGVWGFAAADTGPAKGGYFTTASPDGYSGYFVGRSYFSDKLGIGVLNPEERVDVDGTAQMTGFKLTTAPTTGHVLTSDAFGVGSWQPAGAGTITAGAGLDLVGNEMSITPSYRLPQGCSNGQIAEYNGGLWICGSGGSGSGYWTADGNHIFSNNTENVGIGVTEPFQGKVHIETASATPGFALYAKHNGASGTTRGVMAESASSSADAAGVEGRASASTGKTYGVYGVSNSSTDEASGVRGVADTPAGKTYGVSGRTYSGGPGAAGVFGQHYETVVVGYGVHGKTHSSAENAAGVYGEHGANHGTGYGVFGMTTSVFAQAAGVYGEAGAANTFGVKGKNTSSESNAMGVYGWASASTGDTYGVKGQSASNSGTGVWGWATNSSGVTEGVMGTNDSTTNDARGVYGYARGPTGQTYGVYGETDSTAGGTAGVRGYASQTSAGNYGVAGESEGNNGIGVWGHAASTTGVNYGVYGVTASSEGYGGYFVGKGGTVGAFNRQFSDGTIVSFQQDGFEEGTISVSGGTVSYNDFTGSHLAWTDETIERGTLVVMTGDNRHLHDRPESEIIYGIAPSGQANDPRCLGAYLGLQDPSKPRSETRHLVMAVGNGDMWVVDTGQNIRPGDLLISSPVGGHAMRDDEEQFALGYVVARAAEAVDWEKVPDTLDGRKHKKISVFFESFVRGSTARLAAVVEDQREEIVALQERLATLETRVALTGTAPSRGGFGFNAGVGALALAMVGVFGLITHRRTGRGGAR